MNKPKSDSPAMALLLLVWREMRCGSWIRINQSMRSALNLTISARLVFGVDDFAQIARWRPGSFWLGAERESYFTKAVEAGNTSACRAFEKWMGRGPFMVDGKRLCVDAGITVDGLRLFVTSFDSDGQGLIACAYDTAGGYPRSPSRRVRLSRTRIREINRARKAAKKAAKEACAEQDVAA